MATTTNYGWTTPDDTALVKDGAAAIRTLGSSVDTTTKALNPETTLGDISYRSSTANVKTRLPLGTAGQVLKVNSGATAPEWATDASGMTNPMTTTGDTIYSSSGSTPARLAIGTANQQLRVNAGATAPEWFNPAAAGSGFTLIAEQSYTAAQTVNVNNVFSTTYDNYKIINRSTQASAGSWTMKMRVGGADTSANYFTQLVYGDGGTAAGGRNVSGTDEWFFGDSANSGMTSMDILSPFLSAETQGAALAGYRDGSAGLVRMIFMSLGDTTSYTGFSLLTPSNADGKVSIYGYAK
jgi:hypothetical protein